MKVLIEINELSYKMLRHELRNGTLNAWEEIIANGTPLPKGHGRLVDENEVDGLRYKYFDFSDNEVNCIKRGINRLTTIIEADKENKDE